MKIIPLNLIAATLLCAFIPTIVSAASISGQGTWETTLQGRDLDGDFSNGFEAYYDTVLEITWLADANYAKTSGYDTDGKMTWSMANTWAASLDFNGITGWRLPTVTDTGTSGCNYTYSGTDCGYNVDTASGEMAHMYYSTLGDLSFYDTSGVGPQSGWGLTNTGPFSNMQGSIHWSATEYSTGSGYAWAFSPGTGWQGYGSKTINNFAWAVHAGDVGAHVVPVPAAVWLFGSGLIGLMGVARRKAAR